MSRWSPDAVWAVLSPDHAALLRLGRTWTWRGPRTCVAAAEQRACQAAPQASAWQPAIEALVNTLAALPRSKRKASVVLSNHFVHYAMVIPQADLEDVDEERAYARHCFERIYGGTAAQWELRMDERAPFPRLVSAIDNTLLAALHAAFKDAGVTLESIQPHLMAAFNAHARHFRSGSGWFAVVEPGHLCLTRLDKGQIRRVCSARITDSWREQLITLLARESCLDEGAEAVSRVFVWCGHTAGIRFPKHLPWQMCTLAPRMRDPRVVDVLALAAGG